jgi:cyclic 2,3-diphosphoglycerate synthetase
LLRADAVLVVGDARHAALEAGIRELRPGIPVLACTLAARPSAPINGRRVAVFTTSGAATHPALQARLRARYGADVALVSGTLADRPALRAALAQTDADVFVTELKAAAVDVVAEAAAERGAELVFLANEPVALDGSAAVDELLTGLVRAATDTNS